MTTDRDLIDMLEARIAELESRLHAEEYAADTQLRETAAHARDLARARAVVGAARAVREAYGGALTAAQWFPLDEALDEHDREEP